MILLKKKYAIFIQKLIFQVIGKGHKSVTDRKVSCVNESFFVENAHYVLYLAL